jgi:hypothetical protein
VGELERAKPLATHVGSRSFLFYGPGGSGKSTLAINHPGKKKLYIDVDERLHELVIPPAIRDTIQIWTPGVTLGNPEVQIIEVDKTRSNVSAGTLITKKPEGFEKYVALINELLRLHYAAAKGGPPFPFDCVITDSLTKLVDHLIYLIMHKHGVSQMTETLFAVEGRQLKEAIQGFLLLPCDRIMIAHSSHIEKRDKGTGALISERIRPHVYGSNMVREELNTWFSEVYRFIGFDQGKKSYVIQTKTGRISPARSARLNDFEVNIDPKVIYG